MRKLKPFLSILLCFTMLAATLVGCADKPAEITKTPSTTDIGTTETPEASTNQTEATETKQPDSKEFVFTYTADQELSMAYEKGFVPEALWSKLSENVSLGELTEMIRDIVKGKAPEKASEYEKYVGTALSVGLPVDRSLAAIALYYGTHVLEIPETTWFTLGNRDDCWPVGGSDLNNIIGDKWHEFKGLYCNPGYEGTFPHVYDGGYAWDGFWEGGVDTAAYFTMLNRSTFDGRLYFDYDLANNTMHMDYTVSVEEAIRAATRFYLICNSEAMFAETIHNVTEASPHKKPIADYDTEDLVADMTIGIHLHQVGTDWLPGDGGIDGNVVFVDGYDSFYELMLSEWMLVGRDSIKKLLGAYSEKGFNTVRLAVTWTPYMNPETDEIDGDFLDYVEYTVNLILDEGMYVIINSHRDFGGFTDAFVDGESRGDWMEAKYKAEIDRRFEVMWRQIAERFREYDEHVIFEAMNEPHQEAGAEKGDAQYILQTGRVNELNGLFVKTVRATGGNNAKRTLNISCFSGVDSLDALMPPDDGHIITSVHPYFLDTGMIGNYVSGDAGVSTNENGEFLEWSSDTPALKTWVEGRFEQIADFEARTGVPVIIGETGPGALLTETENLDMMTFIISEANKVGAPVILWGVFLCENDGDIDTSYYTPMTDEWHSDAFFDTMVAEARKR